MDAQTSVLLLGAKGMLGQALASAFSHAQLTAWDRDELDIADATAVAQAIGALQPHYIINAAAYTAVDQAEEDRATAFAVNATAVEYIATAAREVQATLVQYSTDYVFPGTNEAGYSENDEPGPPVNAYGESKLAGEVALQQSGATFFLIRTAWLYGSGGKNFVDTMLRIGQERNKVRVVNDQHGCPTFTVDLADATAKLVEGKYAPGIYHLVNAGATTWAGFAEEIYRRAALSVQVEPIPASEYPLPAKRPTYSILNNTRGPQLRPWPQALDAYLATLYT